MEMTAEMLNGRRGGGKLKNLRSKVCYLSVQDCARGLGHNVFGEAHFSAYKTQWYHADKESRNLPWVE